MQKTVPAFSCTFGTSVFSIYQLNMTPVKSTMTFEKLLDVTIIGIDDDHYDDGDDDDDDDDDDDGDGDDVDDDD
ncbi:hypothetical protein ElyMa_005134100 [Elysia marginata]|uniref:Uncharacterized protein n=1 Tax=Elysia marginata TaxID=1093978 RepID=A0AAV4JM77_9GAST|nr:hypothetical protein ElyMa_005134100 [Elysia marginata]